MYRRTQLRNSGAATPRESAWAAAGIRRKKDEEENKDIRVQNQAVIVGFRSAYVFDVSQTDGKGLPELSERVTGNVGEYRERLVDFVIAQGITLEFKGIRPTKRVDSSRVSLVR